MSIRREGSFDDTGFFSGDMLEITRRSITNHKPLFDLAYDLNAFCQKLKYQCDVKNRDLQALITIGLYFRILDSYSSAVILCENNLGHDACAITRVSMEAMFFMKAVAEKDGFVIEYIKSDQKSRLKLLNIASKPDSSLYELFKNDSQHLNKLKEKLKQEVDSEQISEQKAAQVAEMVELGLHYDYAYRILCHYVHPHPRALSKYFKFGSDNEVTELLYPPGEDMVPMALFTSISNLLMAAKILIKSFDLPSTGVDQFEERFVKCNEKYASEVK